MNCGQCQCGNISFELLLPQPIESYSPRLCDCHFCQLNQIIYLSDPQGELILSAQVFTNYQTQGDNKAKFITCENCQQVVAAIYQFKNETKGAVNANLLNRKIDSNSIQNVSPRLLSSEEKTQRWRQLWLTVKTT